MFGVQPYVLELRSVVCVPVFGMRVRASIAVRVAVGLLLDNVQGVLGVHASEGHPCIRTVGNPGGGGIPPLPWTPPPKPPFQCWRPILLPRLQR